MKNKILLMLFIMMGIQFTGYSQIHLHLKKKVENQADNRANSNADDLIGKGFDKVENGIKGLFKKKKNKSTATKESTKNATTSDRKNDNADSVVSANEETQTS